MQRTIAAAFAAAVILLSACGSSTTTTAPPTTPASATAPTAGPASSAPSAAPTTVAPSAVPPPAGTIPWPADFAVEMTAGTYFSSPPFVIPLTIEIAEAGWYAGHLNPVFIDLQRYDGVEIGGVPTRMLAFGWPENVRGNDGPVPVAGLTPEAALDLLTDRGSVKPGARADVELFGLEGQRIDLHSDLNNNPIFGTADGDFGLGPELDVRLVALPLDDGLLMVGVLAPADDLEEAWDQALPMLETVEIVR
jgi:hypothetical protein